MQRPAHHIHPLLCLRAPRRLRVYLQPQPLLRRTRGRKAVSCIPEAVMVAGPDRSRTLSWRRSQLYPASHTSTKHPGHSTLRPSHNRRTVRGIGLRREPGAQGQLLHYLKPLTKLSGEGPHHRHSKLAPQGCRTRMKIGTLSTLTRASGCLINLLYTEKLRNSLVIHHARTTH